MAAVKGSLDEAEKTKLKIDFAEISSDESQTVAISAIKTLLKYIEYSKTKSLHGLTDELQSAIIELKKEKASYTSITSGCDLFMRFMSDMRDDRRDQSFEDCKALMLERGNRYIKKSEKSREKIAKAAAPHIIENSSILIHSRSRVILEILKRAHHLDVKMKVYVTESQPDRSGWEMYKELSSLGINCVQILDSAVGYIMERIDQVFLGAEGVMASGGIINKIGSYTIAMAAKALNKPVYVAAESVKFANEFPLNQSDIPSGDDVISLVDYTPAKYIDLLFTDIGILTTTAVSDELIKLSTS